MIRTVRAHTFETNSSSVHAMVMCTEEEFELLKAGQLGIDAVNDEVCPLGENAYTESYREYIREWDGFDSFEQHYGGVVAFGFYGSNY